MQATRRRLQVIDSHTGGEPTRVVISGFPDLGSGSMSERRGRFRREFDSSRSAIVNEPRGHKAIVGASSRAAAWRGAGKAHHIH